jgi:hypothetical protein
MIFSRLPIGCRGTEYLLQCSLITRGSLDTVYLGITFSGFSIDREI